MGCVWEHFSFTRDLRTQGLARLPVRVCHLPIGKRIFFLVNADVSRELAFLKCIIDTSDQKA